MPMKSEMSMSMSSIAKNNFGLSNASLVKVTRQIQIPDFKDEMSIYSKLRAISPTLDDRTGGLQLNT